MGKENQTSAMEIDNPKPNTSDQIAPKFSINGSFSDPFLADIIIFVDLLIFLSLFSTNY